MRNTFTVVLMLALVTFTSCKKKDADAVPSAPASSAPSPAGANPAAAKPAEAAAALPSTGIAECDAVATTYKKFQACSKISEGDRAVQEVNVSQIKDLAAPYQAAKDPTEKENAKIAADHLCKEQDATLQKLISAAGC